MAETKNNEAKTKAETKNNEAKTKAPKMVKIKLPVDRTDKNNTHQYVCVNGKRFQIERGKTVEVPDYVEEVLRHSEEAADRAFNYAAGAAVTE